MLVPIGIQFELDYRNCRLLQHPDFLKSPTLNITDFISTTLFVHCEIDYFLLSQLSVILVLNFLPLVTISDSYKYSIRLENKNKYQSSTIALLFFKLFPIEIYRLLHVFEPIVEVFSPLWLIDFFERLTNCVESNANKFFWQSNVHATLNVCGPTNA